VERRWCLFTFAVQYAVKTGKFTYNCITTMNFLANFTIIVMVCVFGRHLFSWYPIYFDFHSARSPSGFFSSYFINEVHFWHYKKYGSVGRLTVFGTYVFKSKLYHF
jgi:hypothetical protein